MQAPSAPTGKVAWFKELTDTVRLFMRGVIGTDAYQKYAEHMRRNHPGDAMMTEREFWRDQTDRQDSNPQARCC